MTTSLIVVINNNLTQRNYFNNHEFNYDKNVNIEDDVVVNDKQNKY